MAAVAVMDFKTWGFRDMGSGARQTSQSRHKVGVGLRLVVPDVCKAGTQMDPTCEILANTMRKF